MNKKKDSISNEQINDLAKNHSARIYEPLMKNFNGKYPSQNQDKFTVRFPDGMRDEISKLAEQNGRSMNSEIIHILDTHLTKIKASKRADIIGTSANYQESLDILNQPDDEIAYLSKKIANLLAGYDIFPKK